MKSGYLYLGAVWPSLSDCEEVELSVYEEEIYNFAMRRLADSPKTWIERTKWFEQSLLKEARQQAGRMRKYVKIMD